MFKVKCQLINVGKLTNIIFYKLVDFMRSKLLRFHKKTASFPRYVRFTQII